MLDERLQRQHSSSAFGYELTREGDRGLRAKLAAGFEIAPANRCA
jgi:hypothetical protein